MRFHCIVCGEVPGSKTQLLMDKDFASRGEGRHKGHSFA